MEHFTFIAASYAVSALGLGLLAAWLLVDNAAQKRALAELEARGVRRRSSAAAKLEEHAP
ncbi:heme exporter protein CcmD [Xanthobacter pseudotagetidis]|uniref:heme exporter protein CcmD n=1 Tax=Xanthobacter pseudotagetidis TaxID=3119911 RepID=UPI003728316D